MPNSLQYHTRKRITREEMFAQICKVVAQRSTCLRSQVGALIVKDGRIISMGYNGPVSGMPACITKEAPTTSPWDLVLSPVDWLKVFPDEPSTWPDRQLEKHLCMGPGCTRSLHAETNAIAFAARAGVSVEGCTLYCSMSPCINCAKVIVNSGIREVVYLEKYRDTSGVDLLKQAGLIVKYSPDDLRTREEKV